jgi:hypothetical protein
MLLLPGAAREKERRAVSPTAQPDSPDILRPASGEQSSWCGARMRRRICPRELCCARFGAASYAAVRPFRSHAAPFLRRVHEERSGGRAGLAVSVSCCHASRRGRRRRCRVLHGLQSQATSARPAARSVQHHAQRRRPPARLSERLGVGLRPGLPSCRAVPRTATQRPSMSRSCCPCTDCSRFERRRVKPCASPGPGVGK